MSTVTLSKPLCAITSAENPDGMASQAFTTALPEAQTFLTLFVVMDRVSFCDRYNGFHLLAFTCLLAHGPLDIGFADTNLARSMTIAAQVSSGSGTPFLVRSARIFFSGSPGISTASTPAIGSVARMKST